jgi:hypothetical protein
MVPPVCTLWDIGETLADGSWSTSKETLAMTEIPNRWIVATTVKVPRSKYVLGSDMEIFIFSNALALILY